MLTWCWLKVKKLNKNLPHSGMWIWDFINGDRGTEEEQSVPGCGVTCTQPPGSSDRHAAECDGAWCPGHRQGNITIIRAAATIPVKALGFTVISSTLHDTGEWNITCVDLWARMMVWRWGIIELNMDTACMILLICPCSSVAYFAGEMHI